MSGCRKCRIALHAILRDQPPAEIGQARLIEALDAPQIANHRFTH
jgi:hypothetical protein